MNFIGYRSNIYSFSIDDRINAAYEAIGLDNKKDFVKINGNIVKILTPQEVNYLYKSVFKKIDAIPICDIFDNSFIVYTNEDKLQKAHWEGDNVELYGKPQDNLKDLLS